MKLQNIPFGQVLAGAGRIRYNPGVRILVTADLHYDIKRSREPAERLAETVRRVGGDVLVLVGDTAGADLEVFREGLQLFSDFPGQKFLVPGNHCLWCTGNETSIERYENLIPALAAEENFVVLDHNPAEINGVGLLGSIGWYDYSFRDESLGIPLDFYREKLSPGAARYFGGHEELLARHRDTITEKHLALGARWMDGWRVKLETTDEMFLNNLMEKLDRQLRDISSRARQIVVFVHHLPFLELVPKDRPDRFLFAAAFLGSEKIGEILLKYDKISHVYCGHSHWPGEIQRCQMKIINVGSTYIEKQLKVLEIEN